jgi:hypothetical protein
MQITAASNPGATLHAAAQRTPNLFMLIDTKRLFVAKPSRAAQLSRGVIDNGNKTRLPYIDQRGRFSQPSPDSCNE